MHTSGCSLRGSPMISSFRTSCQEELELKTGKNGSTKRFPTRGWQLRVSAVLQMPLVSQKGDTAIRTGDGSVFEVDKTIRYSREVLRCVAEQCFQIAWDSGIVFLAHTKRNP